MGVGKRDGREHEPETVWRAEEMYCADRMSFARVAEATGVSATTLKTWAQKFGWRRKREEIARAESDIRMDRLTARSRVLKKLLESGDAQDAFAVAALEKLAFQMEEAERRREERRVTEVGNGQPQAPPPEEMPRTDEERVDMLEKMLGARLSALLTCPPEKVLPLMRDFAAAQQLVRSLREGRDEALVVSWTDGEANGE